MLAVFLTLLLQELVNCKSHLANQSVLFQNRIKMSPPQFNTSEKQCDDHFHSVRKLAQSIFNLHLNNISEHNNIATSSEIHAVQNF